MRTRKASVNCRLNDRRRSGVESAVRDTQAERRHACWAILGDFFTRLLAMTSANERESGFRWPVRVYYEDTDAGGVVYHAAYLRFMERARTEWLRALGFEQDRLRDDLGVLFVVRRMDIAFKVPARFNDVLTVNVELRGRGGASLDFAQTVVRDADGTLCCHAGVNVVCVDAQRMRPMRIPDDILQALGSEIDDGV